MYRFVAVFALGILLAACAPTSNEKPLLTAEMILPNPDTYGQRDRNYGLTESSDGSIRAFVGQRGDDTNIYVSRKNGTVWTDPVALDFPRREVMMSPHFSPYDGRFYFSTDAQHPDRVGREDLNIWSAILNDDNSLTDARPLPDSINTGGDEDSFALSERGAFIFTSNHTRGVGGFDIYYGNAPEQGDTWEYQPMPHNTSLADTQVAMLPSGESAFYYAHLPDVLGVVDLFRIDRDGESWSQPVNLGPDINSDGVDYGAGFSGDGKRFYFSRDGQLMQIDMQVALDAAKADVN
ncbi:MAG: hypothetical protein AAFQ24_14020 [Pseudomonadota bacterium]